MASPYNFSYSSNSGIYHFTTKNNITYHIVFIEDETLNSVSSSDLHFKNIFQVIIDKKIDGIEHFDTSVSCTIKEILIEFFQNKENTLIYVCSDEAKKAELRFKAFNRWYINSSQKGVISKTDNIIVLGEEKIYSSLLLHKENPSYWDILETFQQIEAVLNNKDR